MLEAQLALFLVDCDGSFSLGGLEELPESPICILCLLWLLCELEGEFVVCTSESRISLTFPGNICIAEPRRSLL